MSKNRLFADLLCKDVTTFTKEELEDRDHQLITLAESILTVPKIESDKNEPQFQSKTIFVYHRLVFFVKKDFNFAQYLTYQDKEHEVVLKYLPKLLSALKALYLSEDPQEQITESQYNNFLNIIISIPNKKLLQEIFFNTKNTDLARTILCSKPDLLIDKDNPYFENIKTLLETASYSQLKMLDKHCSAIDFDSTREEQQLFSSSKIIKQKIADKLYDGQQDIESISDPIYQRDVIVSFFKKAYTTHLRLKPYMFKGVSLENIKFIPQLDILQRHQEGLLSSEVYESFVESLGQNALNPNLKVKFTEKFAPEVETFFSRALLSQQIIDSKKLEEIARALDKLISGDDAMSYLCKTVLKTAALDGKIWLASDPYFVKLDSNNNYQPLEGYCQEYDVAISLEHSTAHITNAIIHELTHKLMRFLFKNDALPYSIDDDNAKKELDVIIDEILKNDNSKNHHMFKNYGLKEFPLELIAFYMGETTEQTFDKAYPNDKPSFIGSKEFAAWIKKYLEPILKDFSVTMDYLGAAKVQNYLQQTKLKFHDWAAEKISEKQDDDLASVMPIFDPFFTDKDSLKVEDISSDHTQHDTTTISILGSEDAF